MEQPTVRTATAADLAGLLRCLRAAFAPFEAAYPRAAYEDTVPGPEALRRRLAEMTVYVALHGDEVVGTIAWRRTGDGAHVRGMAVLPGWQGSGVAARLLEAVEAAAAGCRRLTLETTDPLQRAIRFYERHGFSRTGRVRDYFGIPLHELAKPLRVGGGLLRFKQVDVFTATPFRGNPVAVVFDADGLAEDQMQQIARWTNLSETAFLLGPGAPEADYRLRIFTPGAELPFAGHPTLGACHAWLEAGGRPRAADSVVQRCGVGDVVVVRGEQLAFVAPPVKIEPADDGLVEQALAAVGLARSRLRDARWLDNGPRWLALLLDSAEAVLDSRPDHGALRSLAKVGLAGPFPPGSEAAFEVRAFAAAVGVPEDPVTGSLNASLAQWLIGSGRAPERYTVRQGTRLGRDGRVRVERTPEGEVRVGGACVTCIEGHLVAPGTGP